MTASVASQAGCAEHQVGDKTAEEVFADVHIARLATSACRGDAERVLQIVKNGADPNATGFEGATPLLWAVSCENADGARALVEAGADPNAMVGGRFSAVYAASTIGNPAVLKSLLTLGGDPNARDTANGDTALYEALLRGVEADRWDHFELLLEAGVDVNRPTGTGIDGTIISVAITLGQYDRAIELINHGYKGDLDSLLEKTMARKTSTPENAEAKQRLIEALIKGGK